MDDAFFDKLFALSMAFVALYATWRYIRGIFDDSMWQTEVWKKRPQSERNYAIPIVRFLVGLRLAVIAFALAVRFWWVLAQ